MKNSLPQDAKLVFKGELFEVWQWKQKMYDGSIEIFERVKQVDNVDVIAVVNDKIILEVQEQPDRAEPFISLPGGRCEEKEEPLVTAKRELLEETGYSSDHWELLMEHQPFNKMIWTIYNFIARDCSYEKIPRLDRGEKITVKLVSFDEFIAASQEPTFRNKYLGTYLSRASFDEAFRKKLYKTIFG